MKSAPHEIYCITHRPSGKRYVGCTRHGRAVRFEQHKSASASSAHPLHVAMLSHAQDEFSIESLEMVTGGNPWALERQWMERLNTISPNGFNLPLSKNGTKKPRRHHPQSGPHPEVIAISSRIFAHGLKVGAVLKEADMSPANWSRWARGVAPTLASIDAMNAAIDRLQERNEAK